MKRFLSLFAALFLVFAATLPHPSSTAETPHVVHTQEHVDSPHATWDGSNFQLMSNSSGLKPIENTINWVSRGAQDGGLGMYAWRVPDDPRLSFLGEPGTLLYYGGPGTGYPKETIPIWAGFGASANLPTESFRDQSFNMEIVGFDGPGRMELFNYGGEEWPARRLWSSHDKGLRATWVAQGTHTHNDMTFSKPGHYQVWYRATARTTDGRLIASEPQLLRWQVGGTDPRQTTLHDVPTSYNAAPAEQTGNTPTFSMAPSTADTKGAQEGVLTTLSFDTGNAKDSGHAIFYIDGYQLAEVPVQAGKAQWDEMIGGYSSDFQVVYVPDGTSQSGRWVSAPLQHHTGQAAQSTSEVGEFPTPNSADPAPEFETAPFSPRSHEVAVATSEVMGEDFEVTVTPADADTSVEVKGGLYRVGDEPLQELPERVPADCELNYISSPGNRTLRTYVGDCTGPGYQLLLKITPESRSDAPGAALFSHVFTGGYEALPATSTSYSRSEEHSPQVEQDGWGDRVTLHDGHVDIAPYQREGKLVMAAKDETNNHARGAVWRDLDAVTFAVPRQALKTLRHDVPGLAAAGESVYELPATQRRGLVWPGLSNEHMYQSHPGKYVFHFTPISAPAGGQWRAFNGTQAIAGDHTATSYSEQGSMHRHLAWYFTKPGTYSIGISVDTPLGTTESGILSFRVGETDAAGEVPGAGVPAPGQPGQPQAPAPGSVTPANPNATELTSGHIDFGPLQRDGALGFYVTHESDTYKPQDVALVVGAQRHVQFEAGSLPEDVAAIVGRFVSPGSGFYHLPLTQAPDAPWPGFSTTHVAQHFPDGMNIEVAPQSAPEGGRWWAGHLPGLGVDERTLASSDGPSVVTGDGPFHTHADWIFRTPGEYTIAMRAVSLDGATATGWETITFRVDLGAAGSGSGSGASGSGSGSASGGKTADNSGWKGVFDEAKKMFTAADNLAAKVLDNSPANNPAGAPAGSVPASTGAPGAANTQANSQGRATLAETGAHTQLLWAGALALLGAGALTLGGSAFRRAHATLREG